MARAWLGLFGGLALIASCATSGGVGPDASATGGAAGADASSEGGAAAGAAGSAGVAGGSADGGGIDVSQSDGGLDPDAACATAVEKAEIATLPVDIIWMVDNSASMKPAVDEINKGLNGFASLIASKNLDYRVIMLSLIAKNPVGGLYPICIPQPLAGDDNCGASARYFPVSVGIKSVQPLEQFLGTLGQTTGYLAGDERGSVPWRQWLRPEATKTLVVVSDDNSRLTADQFEHFKGGKNPANSTELPPGILEPTWSGLFEDYVFDGLYGWGSESDPNVNCTYPDSTQPDNVGTVYTELVERTGGVRAKICDGAVAWGPFFDAVAQGVSKASKLSCEIDIPRPEAGVLNPAQVNVALDDGGKQSLIYKVKGAASCDATGGWYYDDDAAPTRVLLCPASCDAAEDALHASASGEVSIAVQFGCDTLIK